MHFKTVCLEAGSVLCFCTDKIVPIKKDNTICDVTIPANKGQFGDVANPYINSVVRASGVAGGGGDQWLEATTAEKHLRITSGPTQKRFQDSRQLGASPCWRSKLGGIRKLECVRISIYQLPYNLIDYRV